jgi:hypothetical protein
VAVGLGDPKKDWDEHSRRWKVIKMKCQHQYCNKVISASVTSKDALKRHVRVSNQHFLYINNYQAMEA